MPGWIWPIIAFGGMGSFIDFVIGSGGQAKVRDFLLNWWVKFSDISWRNLAKREAEFAISLLETLFGRKTFGIRRIGSVAFCYLTSLIVGLFLVFIRRGFEIREIPYEFDYLYYYYYRPYAFAAIITIGGFYASISSVMLITRTFGNLCKRGNLADIFLLLLVTLISFLLLTGWEETLASFKNIIINLMFGINPESATRLLKENLDIIWSWDGLLNPLHLFSRMVDVYHLSYYSYHLDYAFTLFSVYVLGLISGAIRLLCSVVFFLAVITRPIFIGPISLLWARVIESDKPIFTLVFGAASAAGTAVIELSRHV